MPGSAVCSPKGSTGKLVVVGVVLCGSEPSLLRAAAVVVVDAE